MTKDKIKNTPNKSGQTALRYPRIASILKVEAARSFLDPATVSARPVTDFEMERYKQFQVTGYEVKSASEPAEGLYEQVVELRLVNKHTQVERVITDRQKWRWDAEAKRWWLVSGLPDLDAR